MYERSAIQESYDCIAAFYTQAYFDELKRKPFDCVILDRFVHSVEHQGPVWDVGCGPAQVAAYLDAQGIPMSGLDLSEQMISLAQQLNPTIPFVQGSMLALPLPAESLAGIVSFYAIIHLSRIEIDAALREFWRVLRSEGYLLLAFHAGEGELHASEWFGEKVAVTVTLFEGPEMIRSLENAHFTVIALWERPPYDFEYQSRRLYILAKKTL